MRSILIEGSYYEIEQKTKNHNRKCRQSPLNQHGPLNLCSLSASFSLTLMIQKSNREKTPVPTRSLSSPHLPKPGKAKKAYLSLPHRLLPLCGI